MTTGRRCALALLTVPLAAAWLGCDAGGDDDGEGDGFEPSLEMRDGVAILRLGGTHREMGEQYGTLMKDEMAAAVDWLEGSELALMEPLADYYGLIDDARANSYPEILDECAGMASVTADVGWTEDRCLLLAYGDVIIEALAWEMGACSQFVVSGEASADGSIIHGRNLDWSDIPHISENPTLIVRHPDDGIPSVVFGFPGNISPYQGMNAEGLSIASNEADGRVAPDRTGRAHSQMMFKVLQEASSLDEALAFYEGEHHGSAEIHVLADGETGEAAVVEMSTEGIGIKRLVGGVVYETNHFTSDEAAGLDLDPDPDASTVSRYARLQQLLDPEQEDTLYGTVDAAGAVSILRDGTNPITGETVDATQFDGAGTIANNGCLQSFVARPDRGTIYISVGGTPVPQQTYVGFTLEELIWGGDGTAATPPTIE